MINILANPAVERDHPPLALDLIELISRCLGILACLLRLPLGLDESGFNVIQSLNRFQVRRHSFDVCI